MTDEAARSASARAVTEPASSPRPSIAPAVAVYVCYLLAFLTVLTAVAGVIVAYLSQRQAPALLGSHYRFQIRTFWIGLGVTVVGTVASLVLIGYLVLILGAIWYILRCVRGLIWLSQGQPVPDPGSWLVG